MPFESIVFKFKIKQLSYALIPQFHHVLKQRGFFYKVKTLIFTKA